MPISGRITHLWQAQYPSCQITDLAKSVFTRNSLAGRREHRWRASFLEVTIGTRYSPGAPVGTAHPPGWAPGLTAVEHTRRGHLNSGAP